jgi:hypothetical protein
LDSGHLAPIGTLRYRPLVRTGEIMKRLRTQKFG